MLCCCKRIHIVNILHVFVSVMFLYTYFFPEKEQSHTCQEKIIDDY